MTRSTRVIGIDHRFGFPVRAAVAPLMTLSARVIGVDHRFGFPVRAAVAPAA